MSKKTTDNTMPRYIPPGSCLWCGHEPHAERCGGSIRVGQSLNAACTCTHATTSSSSTIGATA